MAKNSAHKRNLERARANRDRGARRPSAAAGQAAAARGLDRRQVMAIVLVLALAVTVLVAALAARGGDDVPVPAVAADGDDGALSDQDAATSGEACPTDGAPEPTSKVYDAPPEMVIDPSATYTATIRTTCGDIEVELFTEGSPTAVNNFVFLASEGYYEGVPFHRVIDGFMIQGGDPSGTGSGGAEGYPGYQFADELEFTEQYVEENGGYVTGTLAMANAGPDTNGSQFFVMDGDTPLPPQYVVFGRTVAGQDVVDRISQVPVAGDQAIDPVRIVAVEVTSG